VENIKNKKIHDKSNIFFKNRDARAWKQKSQPEKTDRKTDCVDGPLMLY